MAREAGRAGEIDVDGVAPDGHGARQMHWPVVAVNVHFVTVHAGWQGPNLVLHGVFRGFDDPAPHPVQVDHLEFAQHRQQLFAAAVVAGR